MRILIDLSMLRHPWCGLGQIAMSYGRWYAEHPEYIAKGCTVTLLVPKEYVGSFGDHVEYLQARDIYRILPSLMPKYDVWHSIHQLSPFRPACRATRRILTIHDVNFIHEKKGAKQRKYTRRLQKECDSAAELCFISHYSQSDTQNHIDCKLTPQHVIYNGVNDLTSGTQSPLPEDFDRQPFFLSIGVVKKKKNLHTLLPMMDLLPEYRLIIAGDDSDPYAHKLRGELPRHPNVNMVGTVNDHQRRWLYAHCAGLLFPSLAEGFGLPVIEAMQWGKPVFCSNSSSLPEIGSKHACYFQDFTPAHMAAVVKNGLASFTPQKSKDEQDYASTYSYERHMDEYWKLYLTH